MSEESTDFLQKWNALYCRVSTIEQAKEGVSLKEQEERLKAYCKALGLTGTPVLYIDDGYSGKDMSRPNVEKLIKDVKNGHVSKVIVTKLDRMSRVLYDLLGFIRLLNQHDSSFISVSESFDTNTPSGRLTLQVLGAVAEFERERIKERVYENMLHAASNGKWLTQNPYGYDLENKELVINKNEAEIVKRVYKDFLYKGTGYRGIAKELNEDGISSKYGKEWSVRSIKLMLTNPVYKGTLVWNRKDRSKGNEVVRDEEDWIVIEEAHPAIIPLEEWEKVQQIISNKKIAPRAQTSPHLLGGYLKCGRCGAAMSISWMGSKNNRRRVYQCSANKNKGTCTSKPYNAEDVEAWFKTGLLQLSNSMGKSLVLSLVHKASQETVNKAKQKIYSSQERYKRKVEAYTAGLIELEDLKKEKEKMEAIIERTENLNATDEVDVEALESALNERIKSIIDAIDALPVVKAKSLVRTLVKKVIVFDEKDIEIELDVS